MKQKIIIFGGSFDPIHNAHLYIAKHAIKKIKAQKLFFVPTYNGIFKNNFHASNKDRIAMLKLAIKSVNNALVSNFDIKTKNAFSINTVNHFKSCYPTSEIYFLIGSDKLNELEKWDHIQQLKDLCTFVCYERKPYPFNKKIANQFNVKYLAKCPLEIASSKLLNQPRKKLIPLAVLNYINTNHLYLIPTLKAMVDDKRFQHCLRVGKLAKQLAIANKLDAKRAFVAGAYHDLAKQLPVDQLVNIATSELKITNYPSWKVLHSYVGAYILKNWFGVKDKMIINAIKNHTIPPKQVSKLDIIVYLADKLEPNRKQEQWSGGIEIDQLVKLAKSNLKQAYLITLKYVQNLVKD